ncbi:hypothetical protein [Bradyrhizobium sp. SZCCHNR3118]|uniref:hypothetical protein n=1 Tax=Bradyrhizobium sp. SZCCHNR3118 TaxID=3057468 RepID=UPI002916A863|nr:hypothetical protein [Bradyrhizobium sp. SZCCHNR3118]
MDILEAERLADKLIADEIAKQDAMWGKLNERADTSKGQLLHAAMGQMDAVWARQQGDGDGAFAQPPSIYPTDWSGFRSYGADIPNIVVAVAFLRQEIKRKLMNDEDYERLARRPDQTYNPETGLPKV